MNLPAAPVDCLTLGEVFASLPDPRSSKGIRHPLGALYSLIVVALLCGEENPERISRFARHHPGLLAVLGFRAPRRPRVASRRGVIAPPSNDMVARALELVDGATLNEFVGRWLARLLERRCMAAVDGKSLRGQDGHVVSVYCPALGQVLWQESVRAGENELSALLRALPGLLERLSRVRVFTGDAGFCHKQVARILAEHGRDYLLQLKAPHATDLGLARGAFGQIAAGRPAAARTVEKRGARADARS